MSFPSIDELNATTDKIFAYAKLTNAWIHTGGAEMLQARASLALTLDEQIMADRLARLMGTDRMHEFGF